MLLSDFSQSPAKAFLKGFLRGMAAPAYIYHTESAPPIPEAITIHTSSLNASSALASDWRAIGLDFDRVIAAHGETTTAN
jgi:hypothetical protein